MATEKAMADTAGMEIIMAKNDHSGVCSQAENGAARE